MEKKYLTTLDITAFLLSELLSRPFLNNLNNLLSPNSFDERTCDSVQQCGSRAMFYEFLDNRGIRYNQALNINMHTMIVQ